MDRALFILLLPLFRAIIGWAMSPGLLCRALAGGPEHLGKVSAGPVGVEGDVGHGSHWHLYARQSLLFSESSRALLPAAFIPSLLFVL